MPRPLSFFLDIMATQKSASCPGGVNDKSPSHQRQPKDDYRQCMPMRRRGDDLYGCACGSTITCSAVCTSLIPVNPFSEEASCSAKMHSRTMRALLGTEAISCSRQEEISCSVTSSQCREGNGTDFSGRLLHTEHATLTVKPQRHYDAGDCFSSSIAEDRSHSPASFTRRRQDSMSPSTKEILSGYSASLTTQKYSSCSVDAHPKIPCDNNSTDCRHVTFNTPNSPSALTAGDASPHPEVDCSGGAHASSSSMSSPLHVGSHLLGCFVSKQGETELEDEMIINPPLQRVVLARSTAACEGSPVLASARTHLISGSRSMYRAQPTVVPSRAACPARRSKDYFSSVDAAPSNREGSDLRCALLPTSLQSGSIGAETLPDGSACLQDFDVDATVPPLGLLFNASDNIPASSAQTVSHHTVVFHSRAGVVCGRNGVATQPSAGGASIGQPTISSAAQPPRPSARRTVCFADALVVHPSAKSDACGSAQSDDDTDEEGNMGTLFPKVLCAAYSRSPSPVSGSVMTVATRAMPKVAPHRILVPPSYGAFATRRRFCGARHRDGHDLPNAFDSNTPLSLDETELY